VSLDLAAYFRRIGHDGPAAPTLETLQQLALRHPGRIPFENLDPLLGRPVALDLDSLQRKLVQGGRGGFCYEHNLLFQAVLEAIGFRVTGLAARVWWGRAAEAPAPPRTHMLLRVDLDDGPRLVDVGFGGLTLTGVLRLEPGVVQATPHEPFRLLVQGDGYVLQALVAGAWQTLYEFDLQPQQRADYEMACWYLCHHPDSRFVRQLLAARVDGTVRYGLLDRAFSVHRPGQPSERRTLDGADALFEVLETRFGVALDGGMRDALRRRGVPH
jgi:Arylamine N-acetyltransferase